jgi:hypothetical protein
MNDYNLCDSPPEQPLVKVEQEREYAINVARNHLKHPERVSIKVLLWARSIVEAYDRKQKVN